MKNKNLLVVSSLILLLFSRQGLACWDLKERSLINGFAELDDVVILSFKDAVNCKPIVGAQVQLGKLEYVNDAQGYVKLPAAPFDEMMDARTSLSVTHRGYIPLNTDLIVEAGTVVNRKLVMSPALPPGKVRFVLSWDNEPADLDLHLKGPGFHISYRNMKNAPNRARLDVDETEGYGPETITLDRIDPGASYSLWVDNYSNDARISGVERVYVYAGAQLVKQIDLPATASRGVHVLDIDQGNFRDINQPSARP